MAVVKADSLTIFVSGMVPVPGASFSQCSGPEVAAARY